MSYNNIENGSRQLGDDEKTISSRAQNLTRQNQNVWERNHKEIQHIHVIYIMPKETLALTLPQNINMNLMTSFYIWESEGYVFI